MSTRKMVRQNFLASVDARVEKSSGDVPSCETVVHRNLYDVTGMSLDVGHDERVWGDRECRPKTKKSAQLRHCIRVLSVETAGVKTS